MDSEVESTTYKGHNITIEYDGNPQDPRTEWDNLTEIHCRSSQHYLGEVVHPNAEDFNLMLAKAKRQGDYVIRVYAYIHSGIALSLASFHGRLPQGHAEFDSGCSGVIIVRRKKMLAEFGGKKWTTKLKKRAYDICESDIKTFTSYLNGEVYGFIVDDHGDSVWGFYSTEDAMDAAKESVDYTVEKDKKSHIEQLKIWIKNRVPFGKRQSMQAAISI